jgi:hypothetical protein
MFFAPTLLALARPEHGNHISILCLSSGVFDSILTPFCPRSGDMLSIFPHQAMPTDSARRERRSSSKVDSILACVRKRILQLLRTRKIPITSVCCTVEP